jgi:hypothetical protein
LISSTIRQNISAAWCGSGIDGLKDGGMAGQPDRAARQNKAYFAGFSPRRLAAFLPYHPFLTGQYGSVDRPPAQRADASLRSTAIKRSISSKVL